MSQNDAGAKKAVPEVVRQAFSELAFCQALNEMSVDVQAVIRDFWDAHMDEFSAFMELGLTFEQIYALVLGWILGFPGALAANDKREEALFDRIVLAACASSVSSVLNERAAKRHLH